MPRHPTANLHGEVNVTIWSIDSDGPDFQAILSGAIGDSGPAVTVLPNGKVDPEHTSEMELELRHGTFRVYIDGIASKFRAVVPRASLRADVLGLFPRHRHGAGRGRVRHRCVPRGQRELLLDPDGQRGPKRPTVRPDRVCQPDPRADRVGRCFVLRTGLP